MALALAASGVASAFPDGAPPAHTGGHGEPSCHSCHFDAPVAATGARVDGLPERYSPGERYRLELVLEIEAALAGFQLAARGSGADQAGALEPVDGATRAVEFDGVIYLGHTGSEPTRWAFVWTAPEAGAVMFDFAANAANGDRSEFGDRIVVGRARVEEGG